MSSKKIGIVYRKTFDKFLEQFDNEKREIIEKAIIRYADGEIALDTKDCKHKPERKKVGIADAMVIVFFDDKGDEWEFIDGVKWFDRAA